MNISIVIPVYNGEETLKKCLDCITDIDYSKKSLDILLVNDGSTDSTLEIAENYKNIRIITLEQNSGRIIARETGAKEAKYDDILFVDARIEVSKNIIKNIERIDYTPLMAGELSLEKYNSDYDTLFYLIRRKVYAPYFPQNKYRKEL
ncbi:MAG: glycosyltransferase family 2 protein, partial [Candidatus Delongbacteria bacterium]|nr:glycosyltransferase family 2 protein [Candidatus Delongbacteria bacterium]